MPNKNYLAGRALEYEVSKRYRELGYETARTAGSHGKFDVIAISTEGRVIMFQCKRVSTQAEMKRLVEDWMTNPPFPPYTAEFTQALVVKVKGTSKFHEYFV